MHRLPTQAVSRVMLGFKTHHSLLSIFTATFVGKLKAAVPTKPAAATTATIATTATTTTASFSVIAASSNKVKIRQAPNITKCSQWVRAVLKCSSSQASANLLIISSSRPVRLHILSAIHVQSGQHSNAAAAFDVTPCGKSDRSRAKAGLRQMR